MLRRRVLSESNLLLFPISSMHTTANTVIMIACVKPYRIGLKVALRRLPLVSQIVKTMGNEAESNRVAPTLRTHSMVSSQNQHE